MKVGCLGKLFQHEDHGIRPRENLFAHEIVINDHIHRIEILRILPMAPENACGYRTLQSGKTKDSIRIAPQNELDEPVAQAADAIVEQDRVGHETVVLDEFSRIRSGARVIEVVGAAIVPDFRGSWTSLWCTFPTRD